MTDDTEAQAHHELEDDASLHDPIPLNLPLPALARIIHYFSTPSSWSMASWIKPNLDVVSSVLAEDAQVKTRANANADADFADALLCAMDFPGFELGPLGAVSPSKMGGKTDPTRNAMPVGTVASGHFYVCLLPLPLAAPMTRQ